MRKNYLNISKDLLKFELIFRFLYLCTYMNKDGYIEFGKSKNKLIMKKDLFEILKLGKSEAYHTINYFLNNNMILLDENNNIKVNKTLVGKKRVINGIGYISIFSIRYLYENIPIRKHIFVDSFLKVLKYSYNKNIDNEFQWIKIPMKLKEISELMGYKNISRTIKDINKLKIKEDAYLVNIGAIENKRFMFLNPDFYKIK